MGRAIVAGGNPAMEAPSTGILASELAVGSVVKLMENGVATEYLIVHRGKPSTLYDDSCDGVWLFRKDIHSLRAWDSAGQKYTLYSASDIHTWLNGTFFNLFGSIERDVIKSVTVPFTGYTSSNSVSPKTGANGVSARVFLLAEPELGSNYLTVVGTKLDYFASGSMDTNRIGYFNGVAEYYWLRTTDSLGYVDLAGDDGYFDSTSAPESSDGVRPCIILPSSALFDEDTMLLKGVA